MQYEIQSENFQGPLDLLYKLVKKNEIEISEISLAKITEKYLFHIKKLKKFNLEQASEFMLLASELLEIKAKLLLPENKNKVDEEDNDLVQRLEEYELFKKITEKMNYYIKESKKCFRSNIKEELKESNNKLKIDVTPSKFKEIYLKAIKSGDEKNKNLHLSEMRSINPDRISVEEKRKEISNIVSKKSYEVEFEDLLYDSDDVLEIVVTLLALLELMRLREIEVSQDKIFSEMKIHKKKQVV